MTPAQRDFVFELTSNTKTHGDWLRVMMFGMGTLMNEQNVLAEILCAEAIRMAEKTPTYTAADELPGIMIELGLCFTKRTNHESE